MKWLGHVNRRGGKNVAEVVRVTAVDGMARRGIPQNRWARTIKKDLEELRIAEELCGNHTLLSTGKGLKDDESSYTSLRMIDYL